MEKTFAENLEQNPAIKVYAKLPGWFLAPTPPGAYNPDWAVLVQHDGEARLYFVVETKSTALLFDHARRGTENAKIQCGKAHFEAIARRDNPAKFIVAASFDDLTNQSEASQPSSR